MTSTFLYGANINANGIRQHYLRFGGKGRAVVLIPGITSPAITWAFVGEELGRDYDVYILDVRGRGLSESGPSLDYSLDTCAADVNAFGPALGLQDVAGIGHSMGGRHFLRAARTGKYERLLIVDPPVSGPGRRPYPIGLQWYLDSLAAARKGITVEEVRKLMPTWTDEQVRLRAEWLHTCCPEAITASHRSFHEDDIHKDFAALSVPSILLAAERGGVIQDSDVAEIRSLNPRLAYHRVANAGHMIPFENLPAFLEQVRTFIG